MESLSPATSRATSAVVVGMKTRDPVVAAAPKALEPISSEAKKWPDMTQIPGVDQIRDPFFAHGEHPAVGQKHRAERPQVDVTGVQPGPVGGSEIVDQGEPGSQTDDGVAEVEGALPRAVTGRDPEVTTGIDDRPRRIPDARHPAGGNHVAG